MVTAKLLTNGGDDERRCVTMSRAIPRAFCSSLVRGNPVINLTLNDMVLFLELVLIPDLFMAAPRYSLKVQCMFPLAVHE